MPVTFWERATAKGDGESFPFQLSVFEWLLRLRAAGVLADAAAVGNYLGLTEPQTAELATLLEMPVTATTDWILLARSVFEISRMNIQELDSIEKAQAALGFVPPP